MLDKKIEASLFTKVTEVGNDLAGWVRLQKLTLFHAMW